MIDRRKSVVLLTVLVIIVSVLACSLPGAKPTPAPIITEDLKVLETQLSAAVTSAAQSGKINLEFTESQLTSAANNELKKQGETRIQDIEIRLDAGLVNISGQVNQDGLEFPLSLSMKILVNSQGRPQTEIVAGKLGPFPIPDSMLEQITSQFDQVLSAQLDASGSELFIENLVIDKGKVSIVAHTG